MSAAWALQLAAAAAPLPGLPHALPRPLLPQWLAANGATWPICFGQDWAEISRLPHIGYSSAHMYQSMR